MNIYEYSWLLAGPTSLSGEEKSVLIVVANNVQEADELVEELYSGSSVAADLPPDGALIVKYPIPVTGRVPHGTTVRGPSE